MKIDFKGESVKGTSHLKNHLDKCNGKSSRDIGPQMLSISKSFPEAAAMLDVLEVYKREKEKLHNHLEKLPGRITLTTDIWTSDHQDIVNDAMVRETVKYLKRSPYATQKFETVKYLKRSPYATQKFETVKYLKRSPYATQKFETVKYLKRSPYATQKFETVKYLKRSPYATQKFETVKYLKRSPYATQKFTHAKYQLRLIDKKKVKMDFSTRWNSTFEMIESAIEMKEVLCRLAQIDRNYKLYPSDEEWKIAKVLCDYLRIFYDATNHFSGSHFLTSNVFFPDVCNIQLHLSKWERSEHGFLSMMAGPMKLKFVKYWEKCCLVSAIAIVFYPRFKMDLAEYYYDKFYGVDAHTHVERVHKATFNLFNEYDDSSSQSEVEASQEVGSSSDHEMGAFLEDHLEDQLSGFDSWSTQFRSSNLSCSSKKSELEKYLEEPLFPRTENFKVLNWWKVNNAKFPTLGKFARYILAVPATTVASKAVFSVGGRVIDDFHASLLPKTIETLVTTQDLLASPKKKSK
ncbi:zinc finger BED domain-containing protein RICESLEEPER 1-like [Olea europaea var. sylvestris]|uniref:zinc finger BED domain-containing protein RICESLEEPER 1-like n=1 Tax=Olea europaea var. sylvestris TaxID=158386 RepID=UPI000C1D4C46|nr:zinc finger BED domain-containing protein RICESLEEPER 1-like [Olea europaea var. sylvestris]